MADAPRRKPAFLVAGTKSGCGKTSLTLAVMAALARRGLAVAAFKTGPDFIDPGLHALITGRVSHNLDGWMMGIKASREVFERGLAQADAAVAEGAMGLFDGVSGDCEEGSAAEMAKALGLPVVLVIDAASVGRSFAATALGFARFDPQVRLAGVIANNLASPGHAALIRQAMADLKDIALLGTVPREAGITLPSRHLGLVTAEDAQLPPGFAGRLADLAEAHIDIKALLGLTREAADLAAPAAQATRQSPPGLGDGPVIAVARDKAFCFTYPENLRLLQAAGARLAFFSPRSDAALPPGASGISLCGGYPELSLEDLSANAPMLDAIRTFAASGGPVYAECGGLMYLSRGVSRADGQFFPLASVFPFAARMEPRRQALGYREVRLSADCLLGPAGTVFRGHEFHYSRLTDETRAAGVGRVFCVSSRSGQDRAAEGYMLGNTLGTYVHAHFASNPDLAAHFVAACARFAGGGLGGSAVRG